MTKFRRHASAQWEGTLKRGTGTMSSESGVLETTGYSFHTRFGDEPGTNPEELIAAAHAGCFSMALANTLKQEGYEPERVETSATAVLEQVDGGFAVTEMHLKVSGAAAGIDKATFRRIVEQADQGCPISNLLRGGLEIVIDEATLIS